MPRPGAASSGSGVCVTWTAPNRTEVLPILVPPPASGQVQVELIYTAVSPGTERSQYLGQTNADVAHPFRPGYSGVGRLVAVGSDVDDLVVGDLVVTNATRHQSHATVEASSCRRVPDGVRPRDAALVELAVIASVGLDSGRVARGDRVVIVGAGPIGVLAGALALARGAAEVTCIARSETTLPAELGLGFERADGDRIGRLDGTVVIDAVGTPDSLRTATSAAARGARIVQLGSPRTAAFELPVEALRSGQLELTGAHISGLGRPWGEAAEEYLEALSSGEIAASALVEDTIDPADAGVWYRELASSSTKGTRLFDWALRDWGGRSTVPEIPARGLTFDSRPREVAIDQASRWVASPLAVPAGSLRLGIVGCGEVSLQNARGIVSAPNCELVRMFDPNHELAEDLAERFGGNAMSSLEDLLSCEDVDAVVVSVPHHLHRSIGEAVLASGKHLVMEKPLAGSIEDADALVAAAEAGVGTLAVCFPNRYDVRVSVARSVVQAGLVGEVQGFDLRFFQDKSPAYWTSGLSGRTTSDWRGRRDLAGGGVLMMNACHYLDLLMHVTGFEVSEVGAFWSPEPGRDVEQSVAATLRLSNGAIGSVSVSSSVRGTRHDELRIWGADGHVEAIPECRVFPLRDEPPFAAGRWNRAVVSDIDIRAAYFADLATALDAGLVPPAGVGAGIAVQRAVDAIYRSAELGQMVTTS